MHHDFIATLPSDGKTVLGSVNKGIPFVISHPETVVAQSVFNLAKMIENVEVDIPAQPKSMVNRIKSLFG